MTIKKLLCASVAATALMAAAASAATVSRVVMKASDAAPASGTAVVDPYLDWINMGGVNEGVAGADALTNNGIDFKDSWIDNNWALVDSVRVSMYNQGSEVAFMEFDPMGADKIDFFDLANMTNSTWGNAAASGMPGQDLGNPYASGQWFSIDGSPGNDRHWYVNNNWGGCSVDRGWFVVLDSSTNYVCNWEDGAGVGVNALGAAERGFLYSTLGTHQNFNDSAIGVASVFAVSVTYDDGTTPGGPNPVPVPASAVLLGTALGGLALRRRKKAA